MWPHSRKLYDGADAARAVGLDDLRAMALRRLPAFAAEYLEGGAEAETTLARNRTIFDDYDLSPKALQGVEGVDLASGAPAAPMRLPLIIAPTGFAGLLWRDGDSALARAAAQAGVAFTQSIASNQRLEIISRTPNLRHWLQIYVFRDRQAVRAVVDRGAAAGCEALVVTVDSLVYGKRDWDARGYAAPGQLRLGLKLEALRHPRWMANVLTRGVPGFENLYDFLPPGAGFAQSATWARAQVDPTLSWRDLAWLRSIWKGRLIIKGVLDASDVARALEIGANAVVLSNHGGRQLDGAPPPLAVLPEIADAFKGRIDLIIDSGFRRGADIVKALALGADAVMLGRAPLYGLAAAGEAGVTRALDILEDEIRRVLSLLGVSHLGELTADHLRPRPPARRLG